MQEIPAAAAKSQQMGSSCGKILGTVFSPLFNAFGRGHHHTAGAAAVATVKSTCEDEEQKEDAAAGKENAAAAEDATGAAYEQHHAPHPPPSEVPEASESEYDEDEAEEEYADFDPLVFIKSLPPLESCAPRFRQALLPRQTRQCKRKVGRRLAMNHLGPVADH